MKKIFLLIFLISILIFIAHYKVVGKAVYGDGIYYYSYVRSAVIDRNLDFKNELEYFKQPIIQTSLGRTANKFSIGSAILWLPFFLLAHIIARGDGYGNIYQIIVGSGSVIYSSLGLYFCFKTTEKLFNKRISLLATIFIWLGTNLFFYTTIDVVNSHSGSFFIASLLVYCWLNKEKRNGSYIILGLLLGLLGMIRLQDLIFMLFIFFIDLKAWWKKILLFSSLVISFLAQLITWRILYGEIKSPYLTGGEQFNWLKPQVVNVLFSSNSSLWYYSPILIFSLIGLWQLREKKSLIGLIGLLLFLIQLYLVSCWYMWWQGASYGGRMFISLMPFFIIGLANFIKTSNVKYRKYIYGLFGLLVIINIGSIINYLLAN